MNQKQILTLLVMVAVLGAAGLMVYNRQNEDRRGGQPLLGKKVLGDLKVNDVEQIRVSQGSNEVNLVKKDDLWRVKERNDYAANYNEISDFLLKARDLKVLRSEQVGASQLPRLSLLSGQGTNAALVIDLKDKSGKPIKSLLLGKVTTQKSNRPSPMGMGDMDDQGWPNGRFVKTSDSDDVSVIAEPLSNIQPKPDQWLNKEFFKIEKPKTIAVDFPAAATNSWKITRETETGEWKLAEAKPTETLDTSKVSGVANPFSSASFNDIDISSSPEQLGLDKPTVVTVETFENFTYTIKLGTKTNENFPLKLEVVAQLPKERTPGKDEKPEDKDRLDKEFKERQKKQEEKLAQEKQYEKWTYLASSWTADQVLKERSQLLAEKKEEKPADGAEGSTNAPPAVVPPTPPQ